jgi:hypothetical protein
MFVYQDGKLYVQDGEKLVGVEIYSDKIIKLKEFTVKKKKESKLLSHFEVVCKFQLNEKAYIFPRDPKQEEVGGEVKDEPTPKVKTTPRKSTRK